MINNHTIETMTKKDTKIIKDAEQNGTPIFILTAKDELSTDTIQEYMELCGKAGCSKNHIQAVYDRKSEFMRWQNHYQERVKLPD